MINGASAYDRILDRLDGVRRNGDHTAMARCPAHDDRNPSLSLRAIEGQTLVYCHAGCALSDVLAAIGMTTGDTLRRAEGRDVPLRRRQVRPPKSRQGLQAERQHQKLRARSTSWPRSPKSSRAAKRSCWWRARRMCMRWNRSA